MSAFQIFDQFCLDFSIAWGIEEAASSFAIRLAIPCCVLSFSIVGCVFLWWQFFDFFKFLGETLGDLTFHAVKSIYLKVKSRIER